MYPLQFALSSYAIVGLTLLIMAATIAVYLLRLPSKSPATHYLLLFFACVALSGVAIILTNAVVFWDRLFAPWQDFWILAGGVALVGFAYSFPVPEYSRESRLAVAVMTGIGLAALAYALFFNTLFLLRPATAPEVDDAYYLLLPLGMLFVMAVFLRRAVHQSAASADADGQPAHIPVWHRLLRPAGREAQGLRNLALALSLAFLPAVQTLLQFPAPYGFILSNIGALLATAAIALVYFNTSSEIRSFMAKLVGISLATILVIFAVAGSIDTYRTEQRLRAERASSVVMVWDQLEAGGSIASAPPGVIYVTSWPTSSPAEASAYSHLYLHPQYDATLFDRLIEDNSSGVAGEWSWAAGADLTTATGRPWTALVRFGTFPIGSSQVDYEAFQVNDGDVTFEVGFALADFNRAISGVVAGWVLLITASAALVLLLFPYFFRHTLVHPLRELLRGIATVNSGNLDVAVPIRFEDEIGYLTRSFNNLTYNLKQSRRRQRELYTELQESYDVLEKRVTDRTRELSAFTDLTTLASSDEPLAQALRPALSHILEAGLCRALALHVVTADQSCLELLAQRNVPLEAAEKIQSIPLAGAFAAQVRAAESPLINPPRDCPQLPAPLSVIGLEAYLGAPLGAAGRSHGWMSFYRLSGQAFSMSEAALLVALARQIAVIVENHRLRARIGEIAVEEERRRLARDLHDSATQLLYSLSLFSRASREALEDGDMVRLQAHLDQMQGTSLQALREVRSLLFELQPPSVAEVGLVQALDMRLDMVERRVGLTATFQVDAALSLPTPLERELYFVALEALNNILKHAGAAHIVMSLQQTADSIEMSIADDGCGFDVARPAPGFGLQNMRQRAQGLGGSLHISSSNGRGTTILVSVPMSWAAGAVALAGEERS